MSKAFKWIGVVVAVGIAGFAIYLSTQPNQSKKTVSPVKTVVEKPSVEAFGLVKARDYKDINLDFPAQVLAVPVKNGQNVKLGEPLIKLNINDYQTMIKSKESELSAARYELFKQQKNLLDVQEVYERAKRQLADQERLWQAGAISQKELDDFRDMVKDKEKIVTDIRLSQDQSSAYNSIAVQTQRVAVAEYDLKRLKDKLNQSFLKENVIVSDFPNAVVYDINCAAGYWVGGTDKQQEKLLSIMSLNNLYISADVDEDFIKDVRIDAPVIIIPVADSNHKYRGRVVRVADMATKQNNQTVVAVEISIDNPDAFLRPNFNVDVEISK